MKQYDAHKKPSIRCMYFIVNFNFSLSLHFSQLIRLNNWIYFIIIRDRFILNLFLQVEITQNRVL